MLSYVAKKDIVLPVVLFSAAENSTGRFRYRYRLFDYNNLFINDSTPDIMRMYSLIQHWLLDWHLITDKTELNPSGMKKILNQPFDFTSQLHTYKQKNSAIVKNSYKEVLFITKNLSEANKVKDYYYQAKKKFENYFDTGYWKIEFRGEQKIAGSHDFNGKKTFSDQIISSLNISLKGEQVAGFFYPGIKPPCKKK